MLDISNFLDGPNGRSHTCYFLLTTDLNKHNVIVERPVVEVVHVYLGDIKNLFETFLNLQVVLT